MMTIREYLSKHNLTVNKVASENDIYTSSMNSMAEKELEKVTITYIFAIAKSLGKTPGQVLDEMAGNEVEENDSEAEEIGNAVIQLVDLLQNTKK